LKIRFPSSKEEIEEARRQFVALSSYTVIRGCTGALDGLLARINCPDANDCDNNQRAYHSGHYNDYGLCVLAICDSCLRFIYFAVAAPGRTSDAVAYDRTDLPRLIESLPEGIYITADAAFVLTEHTLVPFTGTHCEDPDKDAYNYFLSQV
jgi:hypothetical protein